MNLEGLTNFAYFLVGFAIGMLQLYFGWRYFEMQQSRELEKINKAISKIALDIGQLQRISSERSFQFQDKLIDLAAREEAVVEITSEVRDEIIAMINDELIAAGVSIELAQELQNRVAATIEESSDALVDAVSEDSVGMTTKQAEVLQLLLQDMSTREIQDKLGISLSRTRDLIKTIYRKTEVQSKQELLRKYSDTANGSYEN